MNIDKMTLKPSKKQGRISGATSSAEEQILLQEKQRLLNILNSLQDCVYMVDADHSIRFVNPSMVEVFGSPEGKQCFEYIASAHQPCEVCNFREIQEGQTQRNEWLCPANNRIYDVVDTRVFNPDGSVSKLKIMHDITLYKEREQQFEKIRSELEEQVSAHAKKLEENVKRLASAQRIARLGNWLWNVQDNTLLWSEEIYRIFGITDKPTELTYETFLSYVHPEDREKVDQAVRDSFQKRQTYEIEHRIIRPDGKVRFVREHAEVIPGPQQEIIQMQGTVQDITKSKQQQENLLRQARELEKQAHLLELAHDTIIVHDMEGKILFWNKSAERTYGWSRQEALGQNSHELLKTCFTEPLVRVMAQVLAHETWEGQVRHQTRDGREIVAEGRWALQKDDQGKPLAILEIDRDITERIRQEAQIADHQQRLRALTEQLLMTEEQQRREMAEILHDSIGQMLSFVKRELGGMKNRLPESLRYSWQQIRNQIDQAIQQSRSLTEDLSSPTLYTLGLESALEELGDNLEQQEGLAFSFSTEPTLLFLPLNLQVMLYRSVRELILNVVRHAGARQVHVEIRRQPDGVQVKVTDDGRGFDIAALDHSHQGKFGLFSIRERTKYLGGTCTIESAENKGTTVVLELPITQNEPSQGDEI